MEKSGAGSGVGNEVAGTAGDTGAGGSVGERLGVAVGIPHPARSNRITITLKPGCRNFGLFMLALLIQFTPSALKFVNTRVIDKISNFYIGDDSIV